MRTLIIWFASITSLGGCFYVRDVGIPAGDDGSVTSSTPVTFRLKYEFSAGVATDPPCNNELFVQTQGDRGFQGYVTVIDPKGAEVPIIPDCALCFCPSEDWQNTCDSRSAPTVAKLAFNDSVDATWSGTTWPLTFNCASDNRSCQAAAVAASGAYLARFCYAGTSDGVGTGHHVGATTCDDVPFDFPSATGLIEHSVICYGI